MLPLPNICRPIFPIFFIRHPIDRVKSAYTFERQQIADTHGARLAKERDFVGYIRSLLDDPRMRQARNFQTSRLACNEPPENGSELERAMRALDALPFVGLVEEYGKSVERLERQLSPLIPGFRVFVVHANKSEGQPVQLEGRLESIERGIGADLYAELVAANADDLAIFQRVKSAHDAD